MPSGSRIVLRGSAEADIPTPATGQVAIFHDTDLTPDQPAFKDDGGTVTSLRGAAGADAPALTYQDHGNTGAAETVDASAANVHRVVLDAATVTFTFTGAAAAGTPTVIRLRCIQDGTGGRLASWPGSVVWVAGVAPTLSTAAGAVDIIDFETDDGGTTWYGIMVGQRGATGATGATGASGVNGGPIAIPYTFSTTTTDSDPGNGNLRLDNATQLSATTIRADLLDANGATVTAILDSLDDSTGTVKGHIRLTKASDPTKWIVFTVSALASPAGYRNITVAVVAGSGTDPFANSDALILTFARAGDAGTASVATDSVWDAKGDSVWGTGADAAGRLAVGTNGHVPIADSTQSVSVKWGQPAGTILAVKVDTSGDHNAITATTMTDVDATNAAVTFTAPASGNVIVRASFIASADVGGGTGGAVGDILSIGLRESTTDIAGGSGNVIAMRLPVTGATVNLYAPVSVEFYLSGISAGSHTYKLSAKVTNGTRQRGMVGAITDRPLILTVIAAP